MATRSDELIKQIGRDIVLDPRYRSRAWSAIALVGVCAADGPSMHGYLYRLDGSWSGEVPEDADGRILDGIVELRRAMIAERGDQWHQCLIQIVRERQEMSIKFEYDDPDRWSVSPANYQEMVEMLRPL
jgi:hypothetical protein